MQRVGRKHEPVFRLVLTDARNSTKSGRFLEILGSYDARRGEKAEIKTEKVLQWVKNGAQLSPTAHNLLVSKGLITGKKISVLPKKIIETAKDKAKAKIEEATKVEEAPVAEAPEAETATAEPAQAPIEAEPEALVAEEPKTE